MTYFVVQIDKYAVKAYSEEEVEALTEARDLYYGEEAVECRKVLRGLAILMKRRAPLEIVSVIDKNLAEVIKRGLCRDL